MAKKSAKSKGFRKQTAKKPYLTKREIALLCVALVIIGVAAFFLFRYDDGALKVEDGAVVADGDNWLIVNGSNVRGRSRYFKLGEIGEIDGYTREKGRIATDANVPQYAFTAESEDSAVRNIVVTSSHSSAAALAQYSSQALSALDNAEVGEVQSAELGGQTVAYYIYDTSYAEAEEEASEDVQEDGGEAEEPEAEEAASEAAETEAEEAAEAEPNRFTRTVSGYMDVAHDSCIALLAESSADSAGDCASDEALLAALEQAVAAIALEE